jgi:hypothetical protein
MVDTSPPSDIHAYPAQKEERSDSMSVHLTPTELADEMNMKRRDVLAKCIEMNVPILKGRIDKTLFESSLKVFRARDKQATA